MNLHYARPTLTAALLLPACFLVAFFVLGNAIDWPNSLNGSATDYLPLVAAHLDEVRLGYSFYFTACALHALLAVLLTVLLGAARRPGLAIAAVLGVLAGIFKMLGIARWLEAMPMIAGSLGTDPVAAAIAYEALNDYAGVTLGEGLGVGLFTGLWYGAVALASGATDDPADLALPLWLRALFGVTALLSLVGFLGLYGIEVGDLGTLIGSLQYYGYWFLAGALFWRLRAVQAAGTASPASA
ncbi:MAG TPA: DUF4386 family protein [Pseudomonadales bacterium]|nr:DUF4386 family protein [Pseudomonadales bacterium]